MEILADIQADVQIFDQPPTEQARTTIRARSDYLHLAEEDALLLLRGCYAREVSLRGGEYFPDAHTEERLLKVSRWLCSTDTRPWMLFYGGLGNGKTTMARAIRRAMGWVSVRAAWGDRHVPQTTTRHPDAALRYSWSRLFLTPVPRFVTAQELADLARNDEREFSRLKLTGFLIIDDLGCEPQTVKSWGTEMTPVTDVLHTRYASRLPVVMTTNLRGGDLRDAYGERLYDRLAEMAEYVGYTGKSYRP